MLLQKIRERERERLDLLGWLFDICELQFGIVREVCCRLILVLRFGDLLSLGVLQLLDLICGSLFGLCTIRIWYLVFVFGIYEPLVLWFCICERELFGCIWDLGLWECLYTNLYYPKFFVVKFVHRRPWM